MGMLEPTSAEKFEKRIDFQAKIYPIFADFPIQIPENARKRANFVASYLGNRLELREKWAHFRN